MSIPASKPSSDMELRRNDPILGSEGAFDTSAITGSSNSPPPPPPASPKSPPILDPNPSSIISGGPNSNDFWTWLLGPGAGSSYKLQEKNKIKKYYNLLLFIITAGQKI